MKQIAGIRKLLILSIFSLSLFTALGGINPSLVLAECIENPRSGGQIEAQKNCVEAYIKECKKNYGNKFCESLSVQQINKCATGNGNKLKKECIETLRDEFRDKGGTDELGTTGEQRNKGDCKNNDFDKLNENNCGIIKLVVVITNVLSAMAATVIVAMIIVGGIQYSMAGADPSKVQAAKQKIINALLALLLLVFGYGLIQWLVPGGVI